MKKKITQLRWLAAMLMLVAAMVMPSTAWAQITREKPSGEGIADSPYQISTAAELYWFAGLVNGDQSVCNGDISQDTDAWAVLTADIEVSGTWTPIMAYEGTFDGKGHTISGLKNVNATSHLGLFGAIENNSVIRNVGIVNCEFSVTGYPVGGVCGGNDGTIENCYNTGSIKSGSGSYGGGVCGENNGTIKNCYNTGNIVDGDQGQVGGVCGENNGTIENCYNTGPVLQGSISGGICGNNSGTITNCYYLSGTATGGIDQNFAGVPVSAESKTEAKFANGEVAWLLNGKRSEGTAENPLAWYQNIDIVTLDAYPLLDSGHGTVYASTPCPSKFSNTNNLSTEEHANEYTVSEEDKSISAKCSKCGIDRGIITLTVGTTIYDEIHMQQPWMAQSRELQRLSLIRH